MKRITEGKAVNKKKAIQNKPFSLSGGFPDRARLRLNYFEGVVTNTAIGVTQVWAGNGCFDPNITGTGSQPYNFDDWSLQYNRYRVVGSTIWANFITNATTYAATQCLLLVAPRHTTTTVIGSFESAISAPYAKFKILNQLNSGYTPKSDVISHSMSTQKILGLTNAELMSDQYQALFTANPSHLWYWHTSIQANDGTSTITGRLYVKIVYDIEFFDRIELTLDEMVKRRENVKKLLAEAQIAKTKVSDVKEVKNEASASDQLDSLKKTLLSALTNDVKNGGTKKPVNVDVYDTPVSTPTNGGYLIVPNSTIRK